jgi:hypothetical protein
MSKAAITPLLKYEIVEIIKANVFPTYANTYLAIGRPVRWGDASDPEANTEIEDVVYTTNYVNQTFRDMIAMKKVAAADTALVVPRVDWVANTTYDEYRDSLELLSHTDKLTLTGTVNATGNLITSNTAVFTGNLSVGNTITLNTESKQVIGVNATHIVVNTNFTYSVTNGTLVRTDNTYPRFANTFYVRNSKDQVFKVLHNGSDNGTGLPSTIEPTIDIDGQLPENPYIETADGYKWKYLYTIPYGLKQKFFTKNWMPVTDDNAVVAGSTDGRIDIIEIHDGGTGYFLDNGESGNSNSLSIITVTGDGTGAVVTAKVQSGVITEVNVLNGGSGYTYADISIDDPDQLPSGNVADLAAAISPPGGHGSNPRKELGCYSVMTSVDFVGTEGDTIPVGTDVVPFDFRQIVLLRDPMLANGTFANGSVYRTTTKLSLTDPGSTNYTNDETVYTGTSEATATFTATVVNWDPNTNELFVNNIRGEPTVGSTLTGSVSAATSTVLGVEEPDIALFTGDLLYIENRQKIVRDADQTEQIRLVLSF